MKIYKSLEIIIKEDKIKNSLLFAQKLSESSIYNNWNFEKSIINNKHTIIIEVIERKIDIRFDEILEFVKFIKNDKDIISEYSDGNLTLNIDYEYENQCNLEFLPKDLKKLSEFNIALCISCWK